MHHRRTRSIVVVVAASALALGACSDDKKDSTPASTQAPGETQPPTTQAPAGGVTVTIKDFAFSIPGPVTAGVPFTVTNEDGFGHTFSDAGGAFNAPLSGGASTQLTIAEPGSYNIICQIHSQMGATLVVN
jgi:plastocyanin